MEPEALQYNVGELVDGWCDHRSLRALREILAGWPLTSASTDGWADLLKAPEGVRAFVRAALTTNEVDTVERLIVLDALLATDVAEARRRSSRARVCHSR